MLNVGERTLRSGSANLSVARLGLVFVGLACSGCNLQLLADPNASGTATQLSFQVQPTTIGMVGVALSVEPTVQALTRGGFPATGFQGAVTLSLFANPSCTVPASTVVSGNTIAALSGLSSLSAFTIDTAGTYYVQASSPGLSPVCSSSPVVISNTLALSPSPIDVPIGLSQGFAATGGYGSYTWKVVNGGAGGSISGSGSSVTYNAPGSTGLDTVQVTDGGGNVATVPVSVTPSCAGSITRVQVVPSTCAQGTFCQIIANASTESQNITETAGHLLVAIAYGGQCVGCSAGGTAPNMVYTVSDTLGNTYYPGPFYNNGKYNDSAVQIFYAPNILGGANTVTVNSTGVWTGLVLMEYAGVATSNVVDISSGATNPGVTSVGTPSAMTTTTNCDLVVGAVVNGHVPGNSYTAGAGWVEPVLDQWDPAGFVDNIGNLATRGSSVQATVNISSDDGWVAAQMAFRSANTTTLAQPVSLSFLSAPQTVNSNTCSSAVTVQSVDSASNSKATSVGIKFNLSGSGMTYYADAACAYPITSGLIGAGAQSTAFYFKPANPASNSVVVTPTGMSSITQTETVQ